MAQLVKNPPAIQETQAQSLGQGDPLKRKLQPTPVFLPRELQGQRSLEGYSPWGRKTIRHDPATRLAPPWGCFNSQTSSLTL